MGSNCKGCVIERKGVRAQAIEDRRVFASSSQLSIPQNDACALPCTWLECKELGQMETTVFCEYLASKAFPRNTRETFCFAKLCYLIHTFCTHTIYTHITHKSWGVFQRENSSHKPWELEIAIPTIFYTIACGFSSIPLSPFSYPWEVDSLNTYHTLSECSVRFWCCKEALEEIKDGRCNMELVVGFGELDKTRFREVLLEYELGGLRYIG